MRSRRKILAGVSAAALTVGLAPALGVAGLSPASAQTAPVGAGFNLNASDLRFILQQIKISEAHAAGGQLLGNGPNQVESARLPFGLRTVDGSFNNLITTPNQSEFGASDNIFPRVTTPRFRTAEAGTSYTQKTGTVVDSRPRTISNLVVDQTTTNPSAVAAAGPDAVPLPSGTLFIPNRAPDVGLSAPFNSWFTLFGQFFDHGLDLTNKSGGTVFVPLQTDDPLFNDGPDNVPGNADDGPNFMVLTRATNQPGPDGVLGTADDIQDATNQTSSFVDQSQTYTSHPSHQVFLRQYELNAAGDPVSSGKMLVGEDGGLATWSATKAQASDLLGIRLTDADALNIPQVVADAYGRFLPGPNGFPQVMFPGNTVLEGDPAANGGDGIDVTNAVRINHAFLDDIAHHAVPGSGRTPDADPGFTDDNIAGTYDDELLNRHFIAGDGRVNENFGLTAVHHVFHAEHNRLVDYIKALIVDQNIDVTEWQLQPDVWNGERIFQASRFVTEMEYQHLVFEEFARKVQPQVNVFAAYDTSVKPDITAEFAHAVYRFGHSMLTDTVARTNANGTTNDLPLLGAFLNPVGFTDGGPLGTLSSHEAAGSVAMGMTRQVGNEIDEFVTDVLRNRLLGLPLDLATLNLSRARDAGVPPLNSVRRQIFDVTNDPAHQPYESWTDFGLSIKHAESLYNFVAAFGLHPTITSATSVAAKRAAATLIVDAAAGAVGTGAPEDSLDFMLSTGTWASAANGVTTTGLDEVDLWIGGLAEKQQPFGGLLGNTFNYIFETQMENLQDGDRFYYLSRTAGLNLLTQLEGNSFAELIERNTSADGLPADSFSRPDLIFNLNAQAASGPIVDDPATPEYDETTLLIRMPDGTIRFNGEEHVVFLGTPNPDRVFSSEGDDTIRGNNGVDRLEGGAGNDNIIGGNGDDFVTDNFGDDVLKGGDGHDYIASGQGFDLNMGNLGNDFVVAGSDPTETLAGPGNDFVIAGASSDTVFGDDGDDWIEGGTQADLLQGDTGAPFQNDPNEPGNDVIDGDGGDDDYDSEGGNDVMIQGPGIERNEGMLGNDWVTYKTDPQPANADMNFTGLLPDTLDTLRDRFDLTENLSGWNFDDVLRGDSSDATTQVGHELDADGIALINGIAGQLGGATSFSAGNIILGGLGSDLIEGRGGDDIIDGDSWLNVQLRAPDPATPDTTDTKLVDSMTALQADVRAGRINPGDISIVRSIQTPTPGPADFDTAVFTEDRANYTVDNNNGVLTVAHTGGTQVDGTDTLRRVERLTFADQTIEVAAIPTNTPATGTVTISNTQPTQGQALTATQAIVDADGVNAATLVFSWQAEVDPDVWVTVATGTTFTPAAAQSGQRLRVVATFQDGDGVFESITSDPTDEVTGVPAAPIIGNATAGNANATVRWTAPTETGGSAITGFSIRVFVGAGTTPVRTVTAGAAATSLVVNTLTNGTTYTFDVRAVNAIGTGAESARSNAVTPVGAPSDTTAPTVTARTPAVNATSVAVGANVTATFSEPVTGANAANVVLRNPVGQVIPASVTYNAALRRVTLNPTANLAPDTRYTASLSPAIRDAALNPLAATSWSFTTGPAPTVTARTPAVNATNVIRTTNVTATFSEPVTGLNGTTVTLRQGTAANGALIAATVTYNAATRTVTLNPNPTLAGNTQYTVRLTAGVRDIAGNPLTALSWSFRTRA